MYIVNAHNFAKFVLIYLLFMCLFLCPYVTVQEPSHIIEYLPTVVWVTVGSSGDQHNAILFVLSLITQTSAHLVRVEEGIHTVD
jgi:hypothetical protein